MNKIVVTILMELTAHGDSGIKQEQQKFKVHSVPDLIIVMKEKSRAL